ncbi:N-chimaerin-like isoform X2 [Ptychodera flava]|uniref:N-chimaerin-like isoform X2 n=1 Tax=Ptychodera flava TaxID=63121 RepID=UPI00396A6A42
MSSTLEHRRLKLSSRLYNTSDLMAGSSLWKSYLYQLQQQAPQPKRIVCNNHVENKPDHYGRECHGAISREEGDRLLAQAGEGSYLVRESQRSPGSYTLSLRFGGITKNFKLFYDGSHYVGDKTFDTLHDLVADGLITMYMETKAADYIAVMVSEPIYEHHSKFTTVDGRKKKVEKKEVKIDEDLNKVNKTLNDEVDSPTKIRQIEEITPSSYEKPHNFKVHNFVGPNWCEYCGNFMWGLIAQGVKCTDCGLSTHKQCSKLVPNDCQPDKRLIKRVYSIDLTTLVKAHNTTRPIVVDKCIKEIETRGLESEGLYRVSGFNDDIEMVRQAFDKDGANAKIGKSEYNDINTITCALKLYFRQLPIPVIAYEVYQEFVSAAQKPTDKEKVALTHKAIQRLHELKPAHYQTLKFVINHLYNVTKYKNKNLMTAENLGVVFGPTLLRSPDAESLASLGNMKFQQTVVEVLITNHDVIFDL